MSSVVRMIQDMGLPIPNTVMSSNKAFYVHFSLSYTRKQSFRLLKTNLLKISFQAENIQQLRFLAYV